MPGQDSQKLKVIHSLQHKTKLLRDLIVGLGLGFWLGQQQLIIVYLYCGLGIDGATCHFLTVLLVLITCALV